MGLQASTAATRLQPSAVDPSGTSELEAAATRPAGAEGEAAASTTPPPTAADDGEASELTLDTLRPAHWLWIGAEAQATPLWGWGGALLFDAKLAPWLTWVSALGLGESRADIDRGKLLVLSASLRTGLAWLTQGPRGSLHAGAGVRGRWLRLTGEPADAANTTAKHFTAWSLGPSLFAGASVRVAGPVILALELELHHALREVRANVENGSARTLSPWRRSATVGAGLAWGACAHA